MEETSVSKIQYTLTTTTLPGSPTLNTSIESSTVESKSQNFSNAVRRAASLNKDVAFETFNPLHLEAAEALIDALYCKLNFESARLFRSSHQYHYYLSFSLSECLISRAMQNFLINRSIFLTKRIFRLHIQNTVCGF